MSTSKKLPLTSKSLAASEGQGQGAETLHLHPRELTAIAQEPSGRNLQPVDWGPARAFCAAVAPDGFLTVQAISECPGACRGSAYRHGSLASLQTWIKKAHRNGHGCFLMVNRGDGRGRRAANVTRVRAVFVDLDGAPLEPVLNARVPPSIVCETSPGRYHAYWLVDACPPEDFKNAQIWLARTFAGDPKVNDLPRVMRIPGSFHLKEAPFRTRLVRCEASKRYPWFEFRAAMNMPRSPQSRIPEGGRNSSLFDKGRTLALAGASQDEVAAKLTQINRRQCIPPLTADEVDTIGRNVNERHKRGFFKVPYGLFDSDRFKQLPDAGKLAVLLLLRFQNPVDPEAVILTCGRASDWGLSKERRRAGIKAAVDAGLTRYLQRAAPACAGKLARPDTFAPPSVVSSSGYPS